MQPCHEWQYCLLCWSFQYVLLFCVRMSSLSLHLFVMFLSTSVQLGRGGFSDSWYFVEFPLTLRSLCELDHTVKDHRCLSVEVIEPLPCTGCEVTHDTWRWSNHMVDKLPCSKKYRVWRVGILRLGYGDDWQQRNSTATVQGNVAAAILANLWT